jgi:hypothetical protein
MMLSKKVFCFCGVTVFSCLNASPTSPSLFGSDANDDEIFCATSTACEGAVAPPMSTTSRPTIPAAWDPSP